MKGVSLTAPEIARRKAIILPLRKGGMTLREIAEATEFTQDQVEKIVYYHCPELHKRGYTYSLRSHSLSDLDELPRMPDTGKRCLRCRRMIQKSESYHSVPRGWEHLDTKCKRRVIK